MEHILFPCEFNDLMEKTSSKPGKDVISEKFHHSVNIICSIHVVFAIIELFDELADSFDTNSSLLL